MRPSVEGLIQRMCSCAPEWREAATGFETSPLAASIRERLPDDYVSLIDELGPGEGFVGREYLRLYRLEELSAANQAYEILTYLPHHLLIGSDGGGNAILLNTKQAGAPVEKIPFIPLDPDFGETLGENFSSFLDSLLSHAENADHLHPRSPNPETFGLEIHEKHPVVLGGDPEDTSNKIFLRPSVHAEAVVYFNRLVRNIRERS